MLGVVKSFCLVGTEAVIVDVEVRVQSGKPHFFIIGLGGSAVRESRDRVLSALEHSGFDPPEQILANLAPAELKKDGSALDVPIALAVLVASGQLSQELLRDVMVLGELSLDGALKPVPGALPAAIAALQAGIKRIVVPSSNAQEAALISNVEVIPADSLLEIANVLSGRAMVRPIPVRSGALQTSSVDIADVQGQETAKRALLIAAAGGHNVLMVGPPGCGKSMLAERMSSILPELTESERLEVVKILSSSALSLDQTLAGGRSFRSPHHVISDVGLIGGGSTPQPGEISLAHHGILFLDEFPEFRRSALEALRAPLESGSVLISRAKSRIYFPARFQLVAAMNPCPCGRLGMSNPACKCTRVAIQNYLGRLSQPILDRIDLHVELDAVPLEALTRQQRGSITSKEMQVMVIQAREIQAERAGQLNSRLAGARLRELLRVSPGDENLLQSAASRLGLSARGIMKILKVARTIADLDAELDVQTRHIAEAISFRSLERLQRMTDFSRPTSRP